MDGGLRTHLRQVAAGGAVPLGICALLAFRKDAAPFVLGAI